MKTKEEIISNATNEHDKELMRKDLDRFEKSRSKSDILMMWAVFFTIVGIVGLFFNEWFILSFLPVLLLVYFSLFNTFVNYQEIHLPFLVN